MHENRVEILHISVAESSRGQGIGSKMVLALQSQYSMPLEAETDDDAVDFYRKCGFKTTSIQKYGVIRYTCTLNCTKPLSAVDE